MSGIIFKYAQKFVLAIFLVMTGLSLSGQNGGSVRSLKLTLGGGYGYYFNTFTNVLDEDVKNTKPSFTGKLMWQPEHRLRIGLESGYIEMYSTTRIETGNSTHKLTTNLNVIPLFLSFAMRTTKHIDFNFATGAVLMNYSVLINKSKKGMVTGETISMSNFATGFTWYLPLGERIDLGTEFKYLYIGKTSDSHVSAFLNFSYKIVNWQVK